MVPTSSLSQMFDIINNETKLQSYSTEQLLDILRLLQNEDLTMIRDSQGNPLLRCFPGILRPVINESDMERIIRLENSLIGELQERGISHLRRKFSKTGL